MRRIIPALIPLVLALIILAAFTVPPWWHSITANVACDYRPGPDWTETSPGSGCWMEP